jgi:pimeloyl-ACP methyl ester carboxylesterase
MRRILTVSAALLSGVTLAHSSPVGTYREEVLTFGRGTVDIACTLSIPSGTGPFPAVVLLSGSGPQDRDSELFGFRPFRLLAERFAKHGIAALRCDDRGVGGSSGRVLDATTEDFADDALAAVDVLRQRRDIQKSRIGLLGHSEGAIVAAIAASRSPNVTFLVWLAGSAVPGAEILRMRAEALARATGAPDDVVDEILCRHAALLTALSEGASEGTLRALGRSLVDAQVSAVPEAQRQLLGTVAVLSDRLLNQTLEVLQSPWMRFFIGFDPSMALRHVVCPVFAAFGGRDLEVPAAANRAQFAAALTEARNYEVTVKAYSEANHLFMPAVTGQIAEYVTLPKVFVASLVDDIAGWIITR